MVGLYEQVAVEEESEIPKYEIELRAWDSPIRNFGISDLRCRIRPISKSPLASMSADDTPH